MTVKIHLTFDKPTISKGILEILSQNLLEDPERDVLKISLKESLAILAKGNKLQYGPANYLLSGILRALSLEDSDVLDEITPSTASTQGDEQDNPPQGLSSRPGLGTQDDQAQKIDKQSPESNPSHKSEPNQNKSKETCKFYTRGCCNRGKDCRFDHPDICKKFRKFGSKSTNSNGCDGKCNAFHPNACRNSLNNKTCSFKDCRFFHLKGTKMTSSNDTTNQNWRSNKQAKSQGGARTDRMGQDHSRSQPQSESKNRFASLNRKQRKPDRKPQEDQHILGEMLDAIMKRLAAMEARQALMPMLAPAPAQHLQPLLSPAVPQPGTQTQLQWASPNQWSQTQY